MRTDAPVIQQAYRFALAPTADQEQFLPACAGASRFWFNHGLASYVACTGRFTSTARGGQVSLVGIGQRSPVKREASTDASQRGDAPALAAQPGGFSPTKKREGGIAPCGWSSSA